MTNEELMLELAKKYGVVIGQRDDADYQINQKNWTKLVVVLEYLGVEAERLGGKLDPVNLTPKEQHGYIEATFDILDIYGDSLKAFINTLSMIDVFSVEALNNGQIRIGMNINNIYEKK